MHSCACTCACTPTYTVTFYGQVLFTKQPFTSIQQQQHSTPSKHLGVTTCEIKQETQSKFFSSSDFLTLMPQLMCFD